MLAEVLFWFHPLVWWIGLRLVEERERACDEEVLRTAADPQNYAEGIVAVCRYFLQSPLLCVSGATGSHLKRRVEAIMMNRNAHRLNCGRRLLLATAGLTTVIVPIAVSVFRLQAQPSEKFEVASIKPTSPGLGMMIRQLSPGRLSVDHVPLPLLIQYAFDARSWEISGGPAWISSAYYAIDAKAPGPASSTAMWRMVRPLLEDRFKMKWHREKRVMPVYALSVAKSGKLPKPQEGSCAAVDRSTPPSQAAPGKRALAPCGSVLMPVSPHRAELYGGKVQMSAFVSRLTDILGRPVVDQTGFAAVFDLQLEFAYEAPRRVHPFEEPPSESSGPLASEPSDAPDIFTALQQQLGLRIHSDKAPIDVITIDSIEKPSSN